MLHVQERNLTVFQSALFKTNSAVIQSKDAVILTDPTWLPDEIDEIRKYIDAHIGSRKLYIIYTHSDFDHIIGSGAFPEATVIASKAFQDNPDKEKVVQEIRDFDQTYYLERAYTPTYPAVDTVISRDGETLQLGKLTLTFYLAPGHTEDGLYTVVEPYGIFLSGDYLSDVEFPFITSNYKEYVKTVEKASFIMDNYDIQFQVPGHGNVTDNTQELVQRIAFSEDYLKRLKKYDSTLEHDLKANYQFFEGMKDSHYENLKLLKDK